jgi:hypothetical protein
MLADVAFFLCGIIKKWNIISLFFVYFWYVVMHQYWEEFLLGRQTLVDIKDLSQFPSLGVLGHSQPRLYDRV